MSERNEGRAAATPREIWAILREVSESQRETDRTKRTSSRGHSARSDVLIPAMSGQDGG